VPNLGTEGESVTKRLAFPPEGWVVPVQPGNLRPVRLHCNSLLQGHFVLSMTGTQEVVRLWHVPSTNGTPLLAAGQTVTNGMPVTFATPGGVTEVWLEALAPGTASVTFSFIGTGNAQGFNHADTLDIMAKDIRLTIAKPTLTLLETNTVSMVVLPNSLTVSNYVFEISRTNLPLAWHTLSQGADTFTNVARTAGNFWVRASAYVNGEQTYTPYENLEAQFPTLDGITNSAPLRGILDGMWASTLAAALPDGSRREEGCYITLDTATGQYGKVAHTEGYIVAVNQGARWHTAARIRPSDVPTNPSPTSTAVYVVGWFHTHTPTTYRTYAGFNGRPVGPTDPGDYNWSVHTNIALPGLVYDYTEYAVPGHPLNSPAKLYPITPPERRATP